MKNSGLIGKNIKYSFSKLIHNCFDNKNYELINFSSIIKCKKFINSKKFNYLNVTIPYKSLAFKSADVLSPISAKTKVVNLLVNRNNKIYGYNTDVYGFEMLLKTNHICVKNHKCLILGTGASSRSVAFVLNKLKAKTIKFVSRNVKNSNTYLYSEIAQFNDAEIIINTTPVKNNSLFDFSEFKKRKIYIDLSYNPYHTFMLLQAKANSFKCFNGLDMLIYQAIKSNEIVNNKIIDFFELKQKVICKNYNIVLIGHPYSGKTTIGKALAMDLNLNFIDIDNEILSQTNTTIANLFDNKGEQYFRKLESKVIKKIKTVGNVISLGGGSVLSKNNINYLLPNSIIVNLSRPIKLIRIDSTRPLIKSKSNLSSIIVDRKTIYNKYADVTVINSNSVEQVVVQIKDKLWKSI